MKTTRYTYVSILGYGDALISLQLLQKTSPFPAPLQIAGTHITQEVQSTIVGSTYPLVEVLPDHAAFFRARKARLHQSIRELLAVRKWAESTLGPDDMVLFEKPDPRNSLMLGRCKAHMVAPKRSTSIYIDRQRMLQELTGCNFALPDCMQPLAAPSSVLINPSSRVFEKEFSSTVLRNLLNIFRRRGMSISITDPDSKFVDIEDQFDQYYGRLKLPEAIRVMREHDLYIGPDSFFIHLAYYLRVPFIALVPNANFNFYFAPPGSIRLRNFISMPKADDLAHLTDAIGAFVGW